MPPTSAANSCLDRAAGACDTVGPESPRMPRSKEVDAWCAWRVAEREGEGTRRRVLASAKPIRRGAAASRGTAKT